MGLLDLGAVRAMQDSIRQNRNLLKKRKKTAKEIADQIPAQGFLTKTEKDFDPEKVAAFKLKMELQRKKHKRLKLIITSVIILLSLTALFMLFI